MQRIVDAVRFRYRHRYTYWYRIRERGQAKVRLLWDNPAIVYIVYGADPTILLDRLSDRPVHLLWAFWWSQSDGMIADAGTRVQALESAYPRAHNHFMANTPGEVDRLRSSVFASALVNYNGLIGEKVSDMDGHEGVRWDAIYDAQIHPTKRHQLASAIENLALISYLYPPARALDHRYARATEEAMRHALW